MKTLEKLPLDNEIITQLAVCQIIFFSKKIIKGLQLSKQQALDADSRAIQQIHFTANSGRAGNTRTFFVL